MIKIIGAGIGGLTAAITLAMRRPGEEGFFEIYERHKNIDKLGGSITLFPNAIRILKNLGCLQELYKSGWIVNNVTFLDAESKLIVKREIGNKIKYGEDTIVIRRKNLVEILLKRLRSLNKDVIFDYNFEIKKNYERLNQCPIIIADGSGSRNRSIIDPGFKREFQGLIYFGGYLNCEIEFLNKIRNNFHLIDFNQTVVINNNLFIGLSAFKNENNEIGLYWYTFLNEIKALNKDKIDQIIREVNCSPVLSAHSNLNFLITEMILKTKTLIVSNIYETIPNDKCISKNFILIGDSAHNINPLSGQGAGMAIEDAYSYSLVMSKINTKDMHSDLKKLFQMRNDRILKIQSKSRRTSKLIRKNLPVFLIKLRNKIYKLLTLVVSNNLKNFDFYYDTHEELKKLKIKL